jgi:hypothetical protein
LQSDVAEASAEMAHFALQIVKIAPESGGTFTLDGPAVHAVGLTGTLIGGTSGLIGS